MSKESPASKMRKQYCQLLPLLQGTATFVERVLEDLPKHDFLLETDVKDYKRTVEKAKERKIKNLKELSDLVRGRVFFSDSYTHKEAIDLLKLLFKDSAKIKNIEWKNDKEHGLEYQGIIHMDLEIGDLNFELQIMPFEFRPHKPLLHAIYEKLRTGNHLSDKQKNLLRRINNKLYKEIDRKAKEKRESS